MDIKELRRLPHLSASSVGDYLDCGLLYKLSRIDKIKPEFKPDALEFGSAIHLVLAEFYKQKMIGNKLSLKDVQEAFEGFWRELAEDNSDIQYAEGKDFETLLREGKELLIPWYNRVSENEFKVIGVEEPFILSLRELAVPILGYVDLIEEDESGTIIITDHKASGRSYSNDETDKNLQLTLYQIAVKANGFQGREILLKFDCLIKTKQPKFDQFWTSRTEQEEKRAIKKVQEVWNGIHKEVFIPNDGHWKCKGCGFKKHCDAFLEGVENDH
ncbi:MAG: PD-(D/E)XK nuclease family protein [Deltaproteobacteria bacterium]|nr:PD-(D/E)XK nuclease family protein [Deltaproteobacteria bacterium]